MKLSKEARLTLCATLEAQAFSTFGAMDWAVERRAALTALARVLRLGVLEVVAPGREAELASAIREAESAIDVARESLLPVDAAKLAVEDFARRAKNAVRNCPPWAPESGAVFISEAFKKMRGYSGGLYEFKEGLVNAYRWGLLELSRADLDKAMDGQAVEKSETRYMSETFHLIKRER